MLHSSSRERIADSAKRAARVRTAQSGEMQAGSSRRPSERAVDPGSYTLFENGDLEASFWQLQHERRIPLGAGSLRKRTPASLREVSAALPEGSAYVCILCEAQGGAALVLRRGSTRVEALSLPNLTTAAVGILMCGDCQPTAERVSVRQGYRRFLRQLGGRRVLYGNAWREWNDLLESRLRWLHQIGWGRLHQWLRERLRLPIGTELLLSLPPALVGLPICAIFDSSSQRHFLDDFAVSQVPNAEWLLRCVHCAAVAQAESPQLLAVVDPGGDLPNEPDWLQVGWQKESRSCEVLYGGDATVSELLARLPGCTHYVHFGHGSRRGRNAVLELAPEHSGDDGPAELSGRQIRRLKLCCNRLTILAACESGPASGSCHSGLSDGLAGSFLKAGSACVIGTLWPVEASTTRRVVAALLKAHSVPSDGGSPLSPARALRLAQLELRDSGLEPVVCDETPRPLSLLHLRPGRQADPSNGTIVQSKLYYWAAFSCLGS